MTSTAETKQTGVGHTPGPWTYLDLGEVVLADDFDVTIATIDYSRERAEEDGKLLAAAPDLLSVALALDASWTETFPEGPEGSRDWAGGFGQLSDETVALWRMCRAALSRAEGRTT